MVEFKLVNCNDEEAMYEYYPEGNTDENVGIIVIGKTDFSVRKFVPSDNDMYIHLPDDFLGNETENIHTDNNNSCKDTGYYVYANHAVNRIEQLYKKENKFPIQGMIMWY